MPLPEQREERTRLLTSIVPRSAHMHYSSFTFNSLHPVSVYSFESQIFSVNGEIIDQILSGMLSLSLSVSLYDVDWYSK